MCGLDSLRHQVGIVVGWGYRNRSAVGTACASALATLMPAAVSADEARARELRTVLFGSLEAGASSFASTGAKHALTGPLDRSGPALMVVAGYGGRFERDPAAPGSPLAFRHAAQGSALLGYQHMLGWGALSGFIGPEFDDEHSHVPGPGIARAARGSARACMARLGSTPRPIRW